MHWPKRYWSDCQKSYDKTEGSKSEVRHRIKSVRKQLKIQQPLLPMQTDTNIWKYNTHLMQGRSGTSWSGSLHINNFSWKQCWKIHSAVKNICYTREKYFFRMTLKSCADGHKSIIVVVYCLYIYSRLSFGACASVKIRAAVLEYLHNQSVEGLILRAIEAHKITCGGAILQR